MEKQRNKKNHQEDIRVYYSWHNQKFLKEKDKKR